VKKPVISGILLCFIFLFLFLPRVNATDIPIKTYSYGTFSLDADGKWRCNAVIRINNTSEGNITLMWAYFDVINITYIDETSERMDFRISNFTFEDQILKPGGICEMDVWFTKAGFKKEPKIIWCQLASHYLEHEFSVISIFSIVPEFPSILILPLFMIATLLAVIVYRKKHSM